HPGARHPVEEIVTQQRGGVLGERQLERIANQLVQNCSGTNGSRDRSSSHTAHVRGIPCRTKSRPKIHNRRTRPLLPGSTASPDLSNHIQLCRTMSYESLDSRL